MSTVEEAKQAIKSIGDDWGYISDELLEGIPEARKREIQRLVRNKDDKISAMITTLAQQLYGSGARFVFELLQNADDNRYDRIRARGEVPYISFSVYPDRIVTECNEDGFTIANLRSICSVGQSTKAASYGYIGAKGIGFKSVFIAASNVHIQSGNYSFYFEHDKGDPGVGMAIPKWREPEEVLPDPLTRMVLRRRQRGDPEELQRLRDTISQQLDDLQQTSLLFLRNLKKITVSFYGENEELQRSKTLQVRGVDSYTSSIEVTITNSEGDATTEEGLYHVTKHMATGLTRSGDRTDLESEESKQASSKAEVILAFPLTEQGTPHIEQHQVFAFLPTRDRRYNFIVQADFQTTASREDVVTDSRRNVDLLDAIAVTFVKAIQEFCTRPGLCFSWPAYLPPIGSGSNQFWVSLNTKIKERMLQVPILKSRHKTELRHINAIHALSSDFKDEDDEPLLDDKTSDPFIASEYTYSLIYGVLKDYGLPNTNLSLCLDLIRLDLKKSDSKIQAKTTTDQWHSALSTVLVNAAQNTKTDNRQLLKYLALLPLEGGSWVTANARTIYLPTTEGIHVPPVASLALLDSSAVNNKIRKELFVLLGAVEPTIAQVRKAILESCPKTGLTLCKPPTQIMSRDHLHYLYSTHRNPKHTEELWGITIYASDGKVVNPHKVDVYIASGDDPLGPTKLLEGVGDIPAHDVHYADKIYLEKTPPKPTPKHMSWEKWCEDCLGLRSRLRLVARGGETLSKEWHYVEQHKPKKLLHLLKHLWEFEKDTISDDLRTKIIDETKGGKLCDPEISGACPLWDTYLPLDKLRQRCSRFMENSEPFPFLDLGKDKSSDEIRAEWTFLHHNFDVNLEDDVWFHMNIAYWIKEANLNPGPLPNHRRYLELYVAIEGQCMGAQDPKELREKVRKNAQTLNLVYAPELGDSEAEWAPPSACLWQAPVNMTKKHSLKHLYAADLESSELRPLKNFFQETLAVPDATWADLTEELELLKEAKCEDLDRILSIYVYLNSLVSEPFDEKMREEFKTKPIIYVTQNGKSSWHTISGCLWTSPTEIRGKVALSELYQDLEHLFIDCLGVQQLSLRMVYDDLLQTGQESSIDEVKSKIWALNSLLETEKEIPDHAPMLEKRIFPVRKADGSVALETAAVEFAIGDREYLEAAFRGKIKLLDYSLADVLNLKPFLKWTGLANRQLSTMTKEVTSVAEGKARPIAKRNRDIHRKSYALLRIAATCNSPRFIADADGLYETFRTLRTVETDNINSVLSITQDGTKVDVPKEVGDMHISEDDSGLTIYVPKNRKKQEYCFASPLPTKLEEWLMRDPKTQQRQALVNNSIVMAIGAILSVHPSVLESILDHKGIIQISIKQNPEDINSDDDDDEASDQSSDEGPKNRQLMSPISMSSESYGGGGGGGGGGYGGGYSGGYHSRGRQSYSPPVDTAYLSLLHKVVASARLTPFPPKGSPGLSTLPQTPLPSSFLSSLSPYETHSSLSRSDSRMERDRKLGAAGELFVFELLSSLSLPHWSRANWTSTLRHLARIHEDYSDLTAWHGTETSDLTYDDVSGAFTELLAEHGYLDEEWWDEKPRYWIEVKATSSRESGTGFFVGRGQVEKMRECHERGDYGEVYVVFRVFALEGERVGLKVYVDPEGMRRRGELVFEEERWAVTPR